LKKLVGFRVSGYVPRDLVSPEGLVRSGLAIMLWATVPEAPVDEDSNPCCGEDDIGASADLWHGARVYAVAQSLTM
jgi:hypothetical protein